MSLEFKKNLHGLHNFVSNPLTLQVFFILGGLFVLLNTHVAMHKIKNKGLILLEKCFAIFFKLFKFGCGHFFCFVGFKSLDCEQAFVTNI